jgi:hypothetical protein
MESVFKPTLSPVYEESRQLITDREFEEAVKKMDVEAEEINTKKEKKTRTCYRE